MKISKQLSYSLLMLFFSMTTTFSCFSQNKFVEKIWESIGGKQKWNTTSYVMFSASGNNVNTTIDGSRKFLLDKSSGDVRFEGVIKDSKLVILFNYKQRQLKKVFSESGDLEDKNFYQDSFQDLLEQFNLDIAALSTPILLAQSNMGNEEQTKMINAEKLIGTSFTGYLGKSGRVYISAETGQIKRLEIGNDTYIVNGYKDIGNGLFLPTKFSSLSDSGKSISFQMVASFTTMEDNKFSAF